MPAPDAVAATAAFVYPPGDPAPSRFRAGAHRARRSCHHSHTPCTFLSTVRAIIRKAAENNRRTGTPFRFRESKASRSTSLRHTGDGPA